MKKVKNRKKINKFIFYWFFEFFVDFRFFIFFVLFFYFWFQKLEYANKNYFLIFRTQTKNPRKFYHKINLKNWWFLFSADPQCDPSLWITTYDLSIYKGILGPTKYLFFLSFGIFYFFRKKIKIQEKINFQEQSSSNYNIMHLKVGATGKL